MLLPEVINAANELWPLRCPNCKLEVGARVVQKSEAIDILESKIANMMPAELMEYWERLRSKYASTVDQQFLASLIDE